MIDTHEVPRGQNVAYLRVSGKNQNLDRQEAMAEQADKAYREKKTGTNRDRPVLKECLEYLRTGDTLQVWSVDRLARSLRDLKNMTAELLERGISLHFVKDNFVFAPDSEASAVQKLQYNNLGVYAEFERDLARERQAEGIVEGQKKKVYQKRAKRWALSTEQIEQARNRIDLGVPVAKVARDLGVSRPTLYRALKDETYGSQPDIATIDAQIANEEAERRLSDLAALEMLTAAAELELSLLEEADA